MQLLVSLSLQEGQREGTMNGDLSRVIWIQWDASNMGLALGHHSRPAIICNDHRYRTIQLKFGIAFDLNQSSLFVWEAERVSIPKRAHSQGDASLGIVDVKMYLLISILITQQKDLIWTNEWDRVRAARRFEEQFDTWRSHIYLTGNAHTQLDWETPSQVLLFQCTATISFFNKYKTQTENARSI